VPGTGAWVARTGLAQALLELVQASHLEPMQGWPELMLVLRLELHLELAQASLELAQMRLVPGTGAGVAPGIAPGIGTGVAGIGTDASRSWNWCRGSQN
jgi:hypothetical protein